METKWPVEQKVHYANLIYYHIIQNSDEDRKIEQLIKEQKHNFGINSYEKVIVKSNDLGINVNGDKTKKTSRWKVEKTLSK